MAIDVNNEVALAALHDGIRTDVEAHISYLRRSRGVARKLPGMEGMENHLSAAIAAMEILAGYVRESQGQ